MTEDEWLACPDPNPMLTFLADRISERQKLLFAAASFRRLVHVLPDPRQRAAIALLDGMAEGTVSPEERRRAVSRTRQALPADERPTGDDPYYVALMLYRAVVSGSAAGHAVHATAGLADPLPFQADQAKSIRELVGNPFRPAAMLASWLTPTVLALAAAIYAESAFDRLPILADALEEAGCDDEQVLSHCRGDWPHVRGCWIIDLVLGKS